MRKTLQTRWRRMGSHRQQTQSKIARERMLRERRERKFEKRRLAAAERKEQPSTTTELPPDVPEEHS